MLIPDIQKTMLKTGNSLISIPLSFQRLSSNFCNSSTPTYLKLKSNRIQLEWNKSMHKPTSMLCGPIVFICGRQTFISTLHWAQYNFPLLLLTLKESSCSVKPNFGNFCWSYLRVMSWQYYCKQYVCVYLQNITNQNMYMYSMKVIFFLLKLHKTDNFKVWF